MKGFRSPEETSLEKEVLLATRATSKAQINAPDLTKVSDLERAKARDCSIAWAAEKADRKAEIARKRAENAARTAAILSSPTKARGPTTRVGRPHG